MKAQYIKIDINRLHTGQLEQLAAMIYETSAGSARDNRFPVNAACPRFGAGSGASFPKFKAVVADRILCYEPPQLFIFGNFLISAEYGHRKVA